MSIQFWRTDGFSDETFLDLIDRTFGVTFTGTTEARTWLKNNGYFTSYPDSPINNNLVLNLETNNLNSFIGEPTVNQANTENSRTINLYGGSTGSLSDASEKGKDWKKIIINSISTNFRVAKFDYITHPSGTTKTYSLEYDFGDTSNYYFRVDGFTGASLTSDNGRKLACTFTTTTNNGVLAIFLNNNNTSRTGLSDTIYYRYYQVEEKDHATHFTTSSRTGTTWYDLSGNGNNALLSKTGSDNVDFDSNYYVIYTGRTSYFTGEPNLQNDSVDNTDGSFWYIPNDSSLIPDSGGEWTIMGWVKFRDEGTNSTVNNGCGWFTKGDQKIHAEFHGPSNFRINTATKIDGILSGWGAITKNISYYLDKWALYSVTYKTTGTYAVDNGTLKLYINGQFETSIECIPSGDSNLNIWLGRRQGHHKHYQGGDTYNYLYYTVELTSTEILDYYNTSKINFGL